MGFNLSAGLAAGDAYFQAGDERKLREQREAKMNQENQRFEWERKRAESDLELLPEKQEATRSVIQETIAANGVKAKLRPGEEANALAQQGIDSAMIRFNTDDIPATLKRMKAQKLIDEQGQGEVVAGVLGNFLAADNPQGFIDFANKVAGDTDLLPHTNGVKVVGVAPSKDGYVMSLEGGKQVPLSGAALQQARAKLNAKHDKLEADIYETRMKGNYYANNAVRRGVPRDPKSLTPAQQRSNAEIDAARATMAQLDPDEIKRRSQKATNTGRENPDYDPNLARASSLSGRRKIGDDADFDQRKPDQPPSADTGNRSDIAKRFRADPSMSSRTLGKETPNGIEVMEKGKLIGYFR